MKVGIIIYGLERPLTGISRYTMELVRALNNLVPRPEIYLLLSGGPGPLSELKDFHKIPLQGSRLLPALMTIGQIVIGKHAKRLKLDVIHDPTGTAPIAFANQHAATVSTIHDVFAWSLPGYSSLLDKFIYRYWLTRRCAWTDAVITVSLQSREDILKYLIRDPDKLHVIPYGVSSKFQPLQTDDYQPILHKRFHLTRPYILYVGALTERKNIVRLLKAFAIVQKKYSDLLLVIAGPCSWKQPDIESTIADYNLAEHIQLTGPLTDNELPALYNGALFFAFPSLYEGFGLPVLEAMASGTPVLTSNISSLPEVVGNAGVLVDPNSVEEIAFGMARLISDHALRQECRKLGLNRASSFSWKTTAEKTLAVYEAIRGV